MKLSKITIPALFILVISLFLFQHWYFSGIISQLKQQDSNFQAPTEAATQSVVQLPEFSKLAKQSKNSVVSIEIGSRDSRRGIAGMGSGFIISQDGYLLTNNHVTDGAKSIVVKLANGNEYDAALIGSDPETDLSLIKIEEAGLTPLEFGSVEETLVGSWVVAIGAPFGFEQSVTAGIVSAKSRSVGEQYVPYIQTDVAINVGNSGGPLINLDGKVIGVNSKIISTDGGSVGLSFAIPIDLAVDVVNQLKNHGKVSRGFLGVGYQEVTREIAESFSLENNFGALVNAVSPRSPAEKAGLEVGDIVIAVDGKPIINFNELPFLVGRLRPGVEAELSIIREGETKTLKLVIGSREPIVAENIPEQYFPQPKIQFEDNPLRIKVVELSILLRESYDLDHGVLVESTETGPAQAAGIRSGDIILSISARTIKSILDFDREMAKMSEQGIFPILIRRPGQGTQFIAVEVG